MLIERPKPALDNTFTWSFFTTYSVQSRQIKEIIKKHWGILQTNRFLGPAIPEQAGVIFRGARSIQEQIALNVIDPPKNICLFQQCKGYYPCRKCNVCLHNTCGRCKTDTFMSSVTQQIYSMKHFTTCATRFIVYLLTCPCKKQYVDGPLGHFRCESMNIWPTSEKEKLIIVFPVTI